MREEILKKPKRNYLLPVIKGGLVGLWFHTFANEAREIEFQGQIINDLKDGYYLVSTYEWFMGTFFCMRIYHISDMKGWNIYETNEDMKEYRINHPHVD